MKIRVLKYCSIGGVEYRANDVLDIADADGKQLVKDGLANAGAEEVAAAMREPADSGDPREVIKHTGSAATAERAVDQAAKDSEKR